jgi:hypothetical protein
MHNAVIILEISSESGFTRFDIQQISKWQSSSQLEGGQITGKEKGKFLHSENRYFRAFQKPYTFNKIMTK